MRHQPANIGAITPMTRSLAVQSESWPLKHPFRIARGMKTEATVVVATISENDHAGRGECVPYARYGESVQGVIAQIESVRRQIESGISRDDLQPLLPAGAARNALDCALIDLEAKASGRPAFELLGLPPPAPVRTAFTLSVDEPEAMGRAAAEAAATRLPAAEIEGRRWRGYRAGGSGPPRRAACAADRGCQ